MTTVESRTTCSSLTAIIDGPWSMLGAHGVVNILDFLTAVIGGHWITLGVLGVLIISAFLTAVIGGYGSALGMGAWCKIAVMLMWERQIFYTGVLFRGTLVM